MPANLQINAQITQNGFAVIEDLLEANFVRGLIDQLNNSAQDAQHARRNLLRLPFIRQLSDSPAIRALIEQILGPTARRVRGLFFDKTPGANWKVAWHQDLSIAVNQKIDLPGFGPWSTKDGVVHVQPPLQILQKMLTIRLHLDDCNEENGPLKVIPASHQLGILPDEQIAAARKETPEKICCVKSGGAMLMCPLILHASSTSIRPKHRRVIHLEYAAGNLPAGLQWHEDSLREG